MAPLLAEYGAAKSYIAMLSRTLNFELSKSNIHVQCQVGTLVVVIVVVTLAVLVVLVLMKCYYYSTIIIIQLLFTTATVTILLLYYICTTSITANITVYCTITTIILILLSYHTTLNIIIPHTNFTFPISHYYTLTLQVPMFVTTKLAKLKKASLFVATTQAYARAAIAAIGYETVVSPYWSHALQIWALTNLPEWFVSFVVLHMHAGIRKAGLKKEAKKE